MHGILCMHGRNGEGALLPQDAWRLCTVCLTSGNVCGTFLYKDKTSWHFACPGDCEALEGRIVLSNAMWRSIDIGRRCGAGIKLGTRLRR